METTTSLPPTEQKESLIKCREIQVPHSTFPLQAPVKVKCLKGHRRWIKTEEKAKVVGAVWGTE